MLFGIKTNDKNNTSKIMGFTRSRVRNGLETRVIGGNDNNGYKYQYVRMGGKLLYY